MCLLNFVLWEMDLPHPSPDPDLENRDNNDIYLMITMIIVEMI